MTPTATGTVTPSASPAPPRGEAAWQAWRDLVDALDHPTICRLRREVAARVSAEDPDLEELGGSDINCYAVTYLERGHLVVRPGGYRWADEDQGTEEDKQP